MKTKIKVLAVILSCVLAFGMLPAVANAEDGEQSSDIVSFKIPIDKVVAKEGDSAPGSEEFTFKITAGDFEYETEETESGTYIVGVKLDEKGEYIFNEYTDNKDFGVTLTQNSVKTNGEGVFPFELNLTIDKSKVMENWQSEKAGETWYPYRYYSIFKLTEVNTAKAGWTYDPYEYYVEISAFNGGFMPQDIDDDEDEEYEVSINDYEFSVIVYGKTGEEEYCIVEGAEEPEIPSYLYFENTYSKPVDNPKTGDNAAVLFVILFVACAGVAAMLLGKKKNSAK